ncbi:sigma 54-interacting transcriptional regulator [Pendulispora albinea]|uniref:Sigma 54-interacting transcriptional regulator n=1 Tax=Pendulispora albinea TaxID=2741071 RepID=A0ABZ2LNH7_9BACT
MADEEGANESSIETLIHDRGMQAVRRHHPRLRWTDASGPHELVVRDVSIVGSSQRAQLRVDDRTVSRLHAELELKPDGLWVRDLGSRNGTFVQDVLVSMARIPDNGVLRVGFTQLAMDRAPEDAVVHLWPTDRFGPLIGTSTALRELFASLARIAATDSSVFIQGETGTGKELVARAIHDASPRRDGPFVVVDCAAMSEHRLVEVELFGCVKGAFEGADAREGALESAHGGTLFLDEIGELPLAIQPKLLRALDSREVKRVGETTARTIDVRFVSASHRDLQKMANTRAFREDLYFRLAVLPVRVPPLRERMEDIPLLASHFAARIGGALEPPLLEEMSQMPWFGNVRELRNFVERAIALGAHRALDMATTPAPRMETAYKEFRERWIEFGEREYLRKLLDRHGRQVASAAQEAGLDRTYLYRLLRKHTL